MQNAANGARRVVVTGIGLVTGIGNTREENWTSMMEEMCIRDRSIMASIWSIWSEDRPTERIDRNDSTASSQARRLGKNTMAGVRA